MQPYKGIDFFCKKQYTLLKYLEEEYKVANLFAFFRSKED
jgi:hypothetical protein